MQTGLGVDQIGNPRLIDIPGDAYPNAGDGCDIGAVEATLSVATANEEVPESAGPEDLLGAAFPNPFNRQTTFTIRVAQTQEVAIELYNLLGQRVQQIYAGSLTDGRTYSFDVEAAGLAPGLYIYSVTGSTIAQSRPMLLID